MLNRKLPKISCLLVTANGRFDYFKRSYQCYIDQLYPNRELVIVNEGTIEYQYQISEYTKDRKDVRLVFLNGKYSLGSLRNIAIASSQGDVFVQWDDDDFNLPERLVRQYHWLESSKKNVCFLSSQLQYFFPTQELYVTNWLKFGGGSNIRFALIPGTIMAYKEPFDFMYPNWSHGEDSFVANKICESYNATLLNGLAHINVYSFHGKNVYDLNHHKYISQFRSCSITDLMDLKKDVCEALDYFSFSNEIKVMGRDGLAFLYKKD